jgi:hypothetical protein
MRFKTKEPRTSFVTIFDVIPDLNWDDYTDGILEALFLGTLSSNLARITLGRQGLCGIPG